MKHFLSLIAVLFLTFGIACADIMDSNEGTTSVGNTSPPSASGSITIGKLDDGTSIITIPLSLFGDSVDHVNGARLTIEVDHNIVEESLDSLPYYDSSLSAVIFLLTSNGVVSVDTEVSGQQIEPLREGSVLEITLFRVDDSTVAYEGIISLETSSAHVQSDNVVAVLLPRESYPMLTNEAMFAFDTEEKIPVSSIHGPSLTSLSRELKSSSATEEIIDTICNYVDECTERGPLYWKCISIILKEKELALGFGLDNEWGYVFDTFQDIIDLEDKGDIKARPEILKACLQDIDALICPDGTDFSMLYSRKNTLIHVFLHSLAKNLPSSCQHIFLYSYHKSSLTSLHILHTRKFSKSGE